MTPVCRICSSTELMEILDLGPMPIAHRLLESPGEEEFIHPLSLHFCPRCGFAQINDPVDPSLLYLDYNYCFSSWKPEPHMDDEIGIIRSGSQSRSTFEIGCNDGRFLASLRSSGVDLVVGLEPNPYARSAAEARGLVVFPGMLEESAATEVVQRFGKFDAVVARQVLEHLTDVEAFFRCIDILLAQDGHLFVDIPSFETALTMGDCSLLWEEHCNYFTELTLVHTLRRFGYEAERVARYNFSGGTVAVLARRTGVSAGFPDVQGLTTTARAFRGKVDAYANLLHQAADRARAKGFGIVIYGVGCRACTLVNGLNLGKYLDFAVDDQPERQNKFMPGSRLSIRPREALNATAKSVVCLLAVNQENESKVTEGLKNISSARVECFSLLSPNDIWLELDRLKKFIDE